MPKRRLDGAQVRFGLIAYVKVLEAQSQHPSYNSGSGTKRISYSLPFWTTLQDERNEKIFMECVQIKKLYLQISKYILDFQKMSKISSLQEI